MRILLTDHSRRGDTPSGRFVAALAPWLIGQGHEVHVLSSADGPSFGPDALGAIAFRSMSDDQIVAYRESQRAAFDRDIDAVDPHMVHAQHVWIHGHLALEAGVPYVLTAWDEELDTLRVDRRWSHHAQQAAENAGRIFACNERLAGRVRAAFGDPHGLVVVADCQAPITSACGDQLVAAYRDVHLTRFGKEPS